MQAMHNRWSGFASALLTSSVAVGGGGADQNAGGQGGGSLTPYDQLVLYGVNNDTDELIRYGFGSSQASAIGQLHYPNGILAANVESLGYFNSVPN